MVRDDRAESHLVISANYADIIRNLVCRHAVCGTCAVSAIAYSHIAAAGH
jgi:succinate dehydrogenase/fumarate reductase-like Fe-S protein